MKKQILKSIGLLATLGVALTCIYYSAKGFAYYTNTVKWGNTRITTQQAVDSLSIRRVTFCTDNQSISIHAGAKFFYVAINGEMVDTTCTYDSLQAAMYFHRLSN